MVLKTNDNKVLVNNDIHLDKILLIAESGAVLGEMNSDTANSIANEQELDLVLIAPNSNPPVCKIMDYGKYRFEQTKKEKENRKKQKNITTKEIQVSYRIDKHDFETKVKNARKFLISDNRVYVVMRLRGRENIMAEMGISVLKNFFSECEDIATLVKPIKQEGNQISFLMTKKI